MKIYNEIRERKHEGCILSEIVEKVQGGRLEKLLLPHMKYI